MTTETQTPASKSTAATVAAKVETAVSNELTSVELSLAAAVSANPKKALLIAAALFVAGLLVGKIF
jgi:hypothetical protein